MAYIINKTKHATHPFPADGVWLGAAYPDLLGGVVIQRGRRRRLRLHLDHAGIEEPLVEVGRSPATEGARGGRRRVGGQGRVPLGGRGRRGGRGGFFFALFGLGFGFVLRLVFRLLRLVVRGGGGGRARGTGGVRLSLNLVAVLSMVPVVRHRLVLLGTLAQPPLPLAPGRQPVHVVQEVVLEPRHVLGTGPRVVTQDLLERRERGDGVVVDLVDQVVEVIVLLVRVVLGRGRRLVPVPVPGHLPYNTDLL